MKDERKVAEKEKNKEEFKNLVPDDSIKKHVEEKMLNQNFFPKFFT